MGILTGKKYSSLKQPFSSVYASASLLALSMYYVSLSSSGHKKPLGLRLSALRHSCVRQVPGVKVGGRVGRGRRERMSPDLAIKHTSTSISPKGQQWESTGTTPTANAPTVVGYTTCRLNAQSLSHKRSIMRRASRQLLSQYLLSLRKARPLLAATQSTRSSPYHGG
jgi:hypothetical protein